MEISEKLVLLHGSVYLHRFLQLECTILNSDLKLNNLCFGTNKVKIANHEYEHFILKTDLSVFACVLQRTSILKTAARQ